MASLIPLTRSSHSNNNRKNEGGLTTRSSTRNNIAPDGKQQPFHDKPATNDAHPHPPPPLMQQQPNIGRKKRYRDTVIEGEGDGRGIKRIAVEITSREVKEVAKIREVIGNKQLPMRAQQTTQLPPQQRRRSPSPLADTKLVVIPTLTESPSPKSKKVVRKHHDKVVNGIKHELDRLQPKAADVKDEKRKLRSQEDQWFKSELSAYLPEYDLVIGNIPKEEHILEADTPVLVVDTGKTPAKPPTTRKSNVVVDDYPLKEFPESIFTDLHDAQRVDFSFMDRNYKEEGGEDPLSDEYFQSIHRKPERLEKTIRNADKGRAQHEKDQVLRLLEGLQGHDWLKLMGVSGITESKKKEYEPARDHFIRGCESLIEKFRWWRDEEKRRKLEKEAAMAEAEEEEDEDEEEEDDDNASNGDPPDYSDIDASAARQLHEEAIARSAPSSKRQRSQVLPAAPPELEKDFVSFFKKPHLREAAMGKHRRSGRIVLAWGQPVPDVVEADFDLPAFMDELKDPEYLKTHARRKRRDRRVSRS